MRNALMWLMLLTGNFYRMRMINQKITSRARASRVAELSKNFEEGWGLRRKEPIGTERDHLVAKVVVCFNSFDMILSLDNSFRCQLFVWTYFSLRRSFLMSPLSLDSNASCGQTLIDLPQIQLWHGGLCSISPDCGAAPVAPTISNQRSPGRSHSIAICHGWCWLQIAMEQRQPQ